MKILHTSDWHIGKKLNDFRRIEEQEDVLNEIIEISDKKDVDAIIISGDLFDSSNPSAEAEELFYRTVKRLSQNGKKAVVAIAGNHDSPDRINAPDPLARECGIILLGYPNSEAKKFNLESGLKLSKSDKGFIELILPSCNYPLRIITVPYANETRLKIYLGHENEDEKLKNILSETWNILANSYCDTKGVNILVAHFYMLKEGDNLIDEPEEEKPILYPGGLEVIHSNLVPKQIQYVALGHLHRKQTIQDNKTKVVYSGSPLAYSFSEAMQDKYVSIVEIEPGKEPEIKFGKLTKGKKLIRKKFSDIDEAVKWLNNQTNSLIELTIVSDTFISAIDRRRLMDSNDNIVDIIPEITLSEPSPTKVVDLEKNIKDLFSDYFYSKFGQLPNKEHFELFNEILSTEEEDDSY